MTGTDAAISFDVLRDMLIESLIEHSQQHHGRLLGATVVTCYKEVVCFDLRSSITSIPTTLRSPYDLAAQSPEFLFDLDGLVASVSRARGSR